MDFGRRRLVGASGALAGALSLGLASGSSAAPSAKGTNAAVVPDATLKKPFAPQLGPRARVVIVNDLSGDVDGLFATVHALLSPSTDVRAIIGTQTGAPGETVQKAIENANEIVKLMGLGRPVPILEGATSKLADISKPVPSPGSDAIIREAMRTDSNLPLFVTVGAGLTEVASALMQEPKIAGKFTLVWIGGRPYPAGGKGETNFNIDPLAAQFVFNQTTIPIWQVTSEAYGMCQVSDTELQVNVAPYGAIGRWLYNKIGEMSAMLVEKFHVNTGETYTLGDSPLVLLTALTSWFPSSFAHGLKFEDTGASLFDELNAPLLNIDGTYSPNPTGRKIRVYRTLDTRLLFADFFAKLRLNYPV